MIGPERAGRMPECGPGQGGKSPVALWSQMPMRLFILAWVIAALAPFPAAAQSYPAKPVKIIVGTSPGGSPDVFARLIAQKMSESWGSVVIENRIGANGNIAAEMVSKSAPDGYTAYVCDSAIWAINPHLYAKVPYRPLEDFARAGGPAPGPLVEGLYAGNVSWLLGLGSSSGSGKATPVS